MAIKITVSPRVKFYVEGTEKDEDGKDVPFKFGLLCKRTDVTAIREETAGNVDMVDYIVSKTETWFDVLDAEGKPIEYSADGLRQLLARPGLPFLTYSTYLRESGAKAKN